MQLADVQQALEQERPYKSSEEKVRVLAFLVSLAEEGLVDRYITYLWVKDELKNISEDDIENEDIKDHSELINLFLLSHNSK